MQPNKILRCTADGIASEPKKIDSDFFSFFLAVYLDAGMSYKSTSWLVFFFVCLCGWETLQRIDTGYLLIFVNMWPVQAVENLIDDRYSAIALTEYHSSSEIC